MGGRVWLQEGKRNRGFEYQPTNQSFLVGIPAE
jgi:hypothetical protein